MKPLISIIIAMKNSKDYIVSMLNSIEEQNYDNIEIIIAYDSSSTDNGLFLLKNFDSKFPLIIDEGIDSSIGEARNRGLKLAKGDFVWFCDADDELYPTSCEDMLEPFLYHENLNVVCGNWYICHTQEGIKIHEKYKQLKNKNRKLKGYDMIDHVDAMHNLWVKRNMSISAWAYMIRRSFLIENAIEFQDYSHGEDQIFVLTLLKNTPFIAKLKKHTYFYKVHDNSISHDHSDASTFWNYHSQYLTDYFNLVAHDFPTTELVAYNDYVRWFVYELTGKPKEEYYRLLKQYGIKIMPIVPRGSPIHAFASILFDIHPELYRIFGRLHRKHVGDPIC